MNVYNIPNEFNSYIKLKGENGKFEYKLNANIGYTTVALGWTEHAVFYYKGRPTIGHQNIRLSQVSGTKWKKDIRKALGGIDNMDSELDYIDFARKDQVRINENIRKSELRERTERVIFPCDGDEPGGFTLPGGQEDEGPDVL